MSVSLLQIDVAATQSGGAVGYSELFAPSRSAPQPPAFLFGTLPAYLASDLFSEFSLGGVGCYRVERGRVTSDGVILHADRALWSLALNHPEYLVRRLVEPAGVNRAALPVRRVTGQLTIIHGPGYNVFGHWLVDFLPRLFVLRQLGFDIARLRFLLPADCPRFGFELLRLIGVRDDQLVRHNDGAELVEADELLVPTILRRKSRLSPCFSEATRYWYDLFCTGAAVASAPAAARRVFVSREHVVGKRLLKNRVEIENMAQRAGYELVHPERLSLADQVRLFRSCTQIVGEYGSGLHNAVFAPPGTRVCALRGTSHSPGFVQSSLAEACGQQIGYVFAPTQEHSNNQPITIEPATFSQALEALGVPLPVAPCGGGLDRAQEGAASPGWLRRVLATVRRR